MIKILRTSFIRKAFWLFLFTLHISYSWSQTTLFQEDFEAATGNQNQATPYLGWQTGQFATTPPTNNNYFWVFDDTRCDVISDNYSMAVSRNNPATTGAMPAYQTNRRASTLVYYTTPINATNYTDITLDFNWICEGEAGYDYGSVLYSLDGNTWAALPGTYQGQNTTQTVTNLDLSVLDGQSFYLGFGWDNDNSAGTFPGFIIDDIEVKGTPLPVCTTPNVPTTLVLTATGNSINGTFTAAAPVPTGYLVVISTSATPPSPVNGTAYTIGTTIGAGYTVVDNDANTAFTATGLNPSTTYYLYVFSYNASCLGGPRYSTTALSNSTTTSSTTYCTPTTTTTRATKYINDVEFIGTLNDVANFGNNYLTTNTSTCALATGSNGFQDWTCKPKSIQAQGEGVNVYVGSSTGRGRYKAWVDWNKNGLFDNNPANGELVYDTGGVLTTTTTFGFVIPANQAIGDYRIRIRFHGARNNSGAEIGGAYNFTSCQVFASGGGTNHFGEAEDYLFTVVPSCPAKITSVTDGETCGPGPVTLEAECATATQYRWYDAKTGGNLVATTATGSWSPVIAVTTTYWVTAYNGNCESLVRTKVVAELNPITELTITPETPVVCGIDDIIEITATADSEIAYLIDEDFEAGGTGVFTVVNWVDNGATNNAITQWQNHTSVFVPNQLVWKPAISSGILGNRFLAATSDIGVASVYTSIESPILDTSTFTDLTLNLDLFFSKYLSGLFTDQIEVWASRNGGTTWALVATYDDDIGYGTAFENQTIDMSAYIGEANLKISIDYIAAWEDGAAVDNIQLFGSRPLNPSYTWVGTVDAYTAATALPGEEYVPGTPISTVYIKPTLAQLSDPDFSFTAVATLSNGCVIEKEIVINNNTRVWNGAGEDEHWNNPNNWSPAVVPTEDNCVVIPGTGTMPTLSYTNGTIPIPPISFGNARNLTLLDGAYLELDEGTDLTVQDWISVHSNAFFNLKNTSSLVQVLDVTTRPNTGNIHVQRAPKSDFSPVGNLNYVYWSSPVENFNIQLVSPNTSSSLRWHWIPTVPGNGDGDHGDWQNASGSMMEGKGYIIRGLSGTPTVIPTTSYPVSNNTALFSGVPNNGEIEVDISRGTWTTADYEGIGNTATVQDDNWNLLGNPYPSSISANEFVTFNTNINGTIYLWPHASLPGTYDDPFYEDYVLNYDNEYIEHNPTGTIPPTVGDVYIASGQSFMVLMEDSSASTNETVIFNNSLREGSQPNTNFYRQSDNTSNNTNTLERHRIWLDLVTSNNQAHTLLVGYIENATNEVDRLYEGYSNIESTTSFYSLIDETTFSIQGRALPFSQEDMVPLGIKVSTNNLFKIGINTLDGLFENENQNIYLEDTYLSIIHDLRNSPYSFSANSGTYNDRFILRFTSETLGVNDPNFNSGLNIMAYDKEIKVTSTNNPINTIEVYDILSRTIVSYKDVNVTEFKFNLTNISNGTFIVKATLYNGQQKVKKIIH